MLETLREIQLPVLALVLLLGAIGKFVDRSSRGQGPTMLLPPRWRRGLTLAHGAAEAVLAVALLALAAPFGDAARVVTAALFVLAVAALIRLRTWNPELGCGCFGGLSTTPVGWRAIGRAALLAAAAAATVGLEVSGVDVLTGLTVQHGVLVAAEAAVVAALSPELPEAARRLFRRPPCEVREVPLRHTLARLRSSDVWRANAAAVTAKHPADVWRQGCWRFVRFEGRRSGRPVDVIFAVPTTGRNPAVRVAITDVESGATLAVLGGVAERPGPPQPRDPGVTAPTGTVVTTDGEARSEPV